MPEMTKYEDGVPSWVDMGAPDLAAAVTFYGQLFGWDCQDLGEEAGHYTMATKNGKMVAALATAMDPGPPRWTTYVNVADADAVTKKVEDAGGKIVVPPMDVMEAGRMVLFQDPTGAFLAAWQPREHQGAQLVNEAGALTWNELSTSDLEAAKAFYTAVFGWGWGGSDDYSEAQVAGRSICGAMHRPEMMPAEVPDHWLVYFGVDDVDAEAKRAAALGATVLVEPTDLPEAGRFAVLADPQGAALGIAKGS